MKLLLDKLVAPLILATAASAAAATYLIVMWTTLGPPPDQFPKAVTAADPIPQDSHRSLAELQDTAKDHKISVAKQYRARVPGEHWRSFESAARTASERRGWLMHNRIETDTKTATSYVALTLPENELADLEDFANSPAQWLNQEPGGRAPAGNASVGLVNATLVIDRSYARSQTLIYASIPLGMAAAASVLGILVRLALITEARISETSRGIENNNT